MQTATGADNRQIAERSSFAPVRRLNPTISTARIAASFRCFETRSLCSKGCYRSIYIAPGVAERPLFCAYETAGVDINRPFRQSPILTRPSRLERVNLML